MRFSRNSGPRFEPPARLFYTPPRSHCNLAYRIPSAARTHRRARSFPSPLRLKPARGEEFDPTGERGTTYFAGAARQPSLRRRAIPHSPSWRGFGGAAGFPRQPVNRIHAEFVKISINIDKLTRYIDKKIKFISLIYIRLCAIVPLSCRKTGGFALSRFLDILPAFGASVPVTLKPCRRSSHP